MLRSDEPLLVLIKGGNDVASAVALALFAEGYRVIVLEGASPRTVRRHMAFASAIFEGGITIQGVGGVRVEDPASARDLAGGGQVIPVLVADLSEALDRLRPTIVVDARMNKQGRSDTRKAEAPLVIGLGPGFTAPHDVHLVIETNRGPHLGAAIREGAAEPYTGIPIDIEGVGRERYTYAPVAGAFRTQLDIGDSVRAGEIVGHVGEIPLTAEVSGIVRGIVKDGLSVAKGQKLVDLDPRGRPESAVTFSDRAIGIANGVIRAIAVWRGQDGG
ncbi:MAG: selenium-dependent molybdenum cofactor biosynthesis protein YqeB [Candidatus Methylomirabilales bacterium]